MMLSIFIESHSTSAIPHANLPSEKNATLSSDETLELEPQPDLPFAARQPLRNLPQGVQLALLNLNRRRIAVVEEIEELKKPLNLEFFANHPSLCDAKVHVDEGRSAEGVATRLEVANGKG